ncbi:MAG: hypothetical protein VKS61_09450 [Candidatus Sericytochromatia bacterium]|nr:hypothetical protein [Candidatus Sericytochromatia bacterium]
MLDPANELSPRNYSREDESARRLWLTQRLKANPWEGRRPPDEEDLPQGKPASAPVDQHEAPGPTVIPQQDALLLEGSKGGDTNPFGTLIVRRLNQ